MTAAAHFRLMAEYNTWMNTKVFDAAARLSAEALAQDRGAFFGSILGTLEHLVIGDTLWLGRFATHRSGGRLAEVAALPKPTALDQIQFGALAPLRARREMLDRAITAWAGGLDAAALDETLTFRRVNGEPNSKPLGPLILHFFNHQTHHRGQVTTLLSQSGIDVGTTDLMMLIPSVD